MGYTVDNAIIMAAGESSRFVPLSYEKPKALLRVRGEILIERQICQLKQVGITEIIVVVGYKREQFYYLKDKYDVIILENDEYNKRNNTGSIMVARKYIKNSYICSADNYFAINPFQKIVDRPYYATVYADDKTNEWCVELDTQGKIQHVSIGGNNKWYMLGHVFWNQEFSDTFLDILDENYEVPDVKDSLWEYLYVKNIDKLDLYAKKYSATDIFEFDTLEELRVFDDAYNLESGSDILKNVAKKLNCEEKDIVNIYPLRDDNGRIVGMQFFCQNQQYQYYYEDIYFKNISIL